MKTTQACSVLDLKDVKKRVGNDLAYLTKILSGKIDESESNAIPAALCSVREAFTLFSKKSVRGRFMNKVSFQDHHYMRKEATERLPKILDAIVANIDDRPVEEARDMVFNAVQEELERLSLRKPDAIRAWTRKGMVPASLLRLAQ